MRFDYSPTCTLNNFVYDKFTLKTANTSEIIQKSPEISVTSLPKYVSVFCLYTFEIIFAKSPNLKNS